MLTCLASRSVAQPYFTSPARCNKLEESTSRLKKGILQFAIGCPTDNSDQARTSNKKHLPILCRRHCVMRWTPQPFATLIRMQVDSFAHVRLGTAVQYFASQLLPAYVRRWNLHRQ